jgi:hypothetical protein
VGTSDISPANRRHHSESRNPAKSTIDGRTLSETYDKFTSFRSSFRFPSIDENRRFRWNSGMGRVVRRQILSPFGWAFVLTVSVAAAMLAFAAAYRYFQLSHH